jgi:hypothetical protein
VENIAETFTSNIREYLEAVAKKHDISLSTLISEGVSDALILLSNLIDDDMLDKFHDFEQLKILADAKNKRIALGKKKSFITSMIESHDKQKKKTT